MNFRDATGLDADSAGPNSVISNVTKQFFKRGAKARRRLDFASQAAGSTLCKRGADACAADITSPTTHVDADRCRCFTLQCMAGVPPSDAACPKSSSDGDAPEMGACP